MSDLGGRPPIWDDSEAFGKACDLYFEQCKQNNEPATWTGLALYLGFESRQSLQDYKSREGFSYPIKKALLRIEENYENPYFQRIQ